MKLKTIYMMRNILLKTAYLFFFSCSCATLIFSSESNAQVATINVTNINTTVMNNTPLLFGITFDSRTSLTGSGALGQVGYYNANATIIPAVDAIFSDFPMSTLRYPANGIAYGFDWKKSVGTGMRPNQNFIRCIR